LLRSQAQSVQIGACGRERSWQSKQVRLQQQQQGSLDLQAVAVPVAAVQWQQLQ
jgi:hypothetical protein